MSRKILVTQFYFKIFKYLEGIYKTIHSIIIANFSITSITNDNHLGNITESSLLFVQVMLQSYHSLFNRDTILEINYDSFKSLSEISL